MPTDYQDKLTAKQTETSQKGKNMPKWLKWVLGILGVGGAAYGANELHKRKFFNKDGYNRLGRDRDGRDRDGYDIHGYNREGRDREGYDIHGRDLEGRDREGFDLCGRDREGYDRSGYDVFGYKKDGKDRAGQTREYYQSLVKDIDRLIYEGKKKLDAHEYRYAISNFRPGLENGVKALLEHRVGRSFYDNKNGDLFNNINRCRQHRIIDDELSEKLHQARKHCTATHDLAIDKEHNQIYFCYKTLQEVLALLIKETLGE